MDGKRWVLCALVTLAGCGRDSTPEPVAATAVAAEAIPEPAEPDDPSAQSDETSAPLVFHVTREGGGGIDAVIKKLDLQDVATNYARVPPSGIKVMNKPCDEGDRFQAEPMVDAFQLEAPKECSTRIQFRLLSTRQTFEYMRRGDDASAAGDFTLAQSNYGIAADRLAYAKPAESKRLRVLSQITAGRALGVTRPVEGAGGNEQPTAEFKDRVRVFQRENGIEQTGELDSRTRESIGRMRLRGADVVVPPAAATTPEATVNPAAVVVAPAGAAAAVPVAAPPLEAHISTVEMLAIPASPEQAEVIRANRKAAQRAARP
jgi:hypothetical protein